MLARRLVRVVAAVLLVGGTVWWLGPELARLPANTEFQWQPLLLAALLVIATLALMSLSLRAAIRAGTETDASPLALLIRITVWRSFAGLLLPLGALGSALLLLRHWAGVSWTASSRIVVLLSVTQIATMLALSAAALIWIGLREDVMEVAQLGMTLLGCALLILFSWMQRHALLPLLLKWRISLPQVLAENANRPQSEWRSVSWLIALQAALFVCRGARLLAIAHVLGYSLGPIEALVVAALAELAIIINLTPGGLGVREVVILTLGTLFGLEPAAGLAIALLDRLILTAVVAALAGVQTLVGNGPGISQAERR